MKKEDIFSLPNRTLTFGPNSLPQVFTELKLVVKCSQTKPGDRVAIVGSIC